MMKFFEKLIKLLRCKHCRARILGLEKEVAFWKEKALNYRKPTIH